MKIFSIQPTNIINSTFVQSKNNSKQVFEEKNQPIKDIPISFWGAVTSAKSCGFRRPKLTDDAMKKIFYLTKNLPKGSNIMQPRMITIGDRDFAYMISKDLTGRAEVEIKDNVISLLDWKDKAKDKNRTILKCHFDPKGMLVGGSLSNNKGNGEIFNAEFKHTGKEGRRLVINDDIYRPVNKDSSKWTLVPDMQTRTKFDMTSDLGTIYSENPLMNSLIELATNRTSLQLLER